MEPRIIGSGADEHLADPFGSAALRRRVLDAWAASPARFREDANAEEELALGGYRDRLVVELAQNAADAAVRAGLDAMLAAARSGESMIPPMLDAVRAEATLGEICNALREEWGTYRENAAF